MNRLDTKNFFLVLLSTCFFFALIVYYATQSSGRTDSIDVAFRAAFRFSLPLLVFILAFRNRIFNFVLYSIIVFSVGSFFPLISLSDLGGILYAGIFFVGLVIGVFVVLISRSNFFQRFPGVVSVFSVLIIGSVALGYWSLGDIRYHAERHAKEVADGYLRCEGNNISIAKFQNICENFTGAPYEQYQEYCFKQLENRKNLGSTSKDFYCPAYGAYRYRNDWQTKFSNYFVSYWNLSLIPSQ